jgi:uncharacterized Fe-S cluster-containing MiaB family protein
VKIDVEGYEKNVLLGMLQTLKNVKGLVIEISKTFIGEESVKKIMQILQNNFFRFFVIEKNDYLRNIDYKNLE